MSYSVHGEDEPWECCLLIGCQRSRLLDNIDLQDLPDLAATDYGICNLTKLVMISMYHKGPENCDKLRESYVITACPKFLIVQYAGANSQYCSRKINYLMVNSKIRKAI